MVLHLHKFINLDELDRYNKFGTDYYTQVKKLLLKPIQSQT